MKKKLILFTYCLLFAQLQLRCMDNIHLDDVGDDDDNWTTVYIDTTPSPSSTQRTNSPSLRAIAPSQQQEQTQALIAAPMIITHRISQSKDQPDHKETSIIVETTGQQDAMLNIRSLILSDEQSPTTPPAPQRISSMPQLTQTSTGNETRHSPYSFADCCRLYFGIQLNRRKSSNSDKNIEQKMPLLGSSTR